MLRGSHRLQQTLKTLDWGTSVRCKWKVSGQVAEFHCGHWLSAGPFPHLNQLPQIPEAILARDSASHSRVSSLLQGETGSCWVFSVRLRCTLHPFTWQVSKGRSGSWVLLTTGRTEGQPDGVEVALDTPGSEWRGISAASPKLKGQPGPGGPPWKWDCRIANSPPTSCNPQKSETQTRGLWLGLVMRTKLCHEHSTGSWKPWHYFWAASDTLSVRHLQSGPHTTPGTGGLSLAFPPPPIYQGSLPLSVKFAPEGSLLGA